MVSVYSAILYVIGNIFPLKFFTNRCSFCGIVMVILLLANSEGLTHFSLPPLFTVYNSQDCVTEELARVTENAACSLLFQMRYSPFAGSSRTPFLGSMFARFCVVLQLMNVAAKKRTAKKICFILFFY